MSGRVLLIGRSGEVGGLAHFGWQFGCEEDVCVVTAEFSFVKLEGSLFSGQVCGGFVHFLGQSFLASAGSVVFLVSSCMGTVYLWSPCRLEVREAFPTGGDFQLPGVLKNASRMTESSASSAASPRRNARCWSASMCDCCICSGVAMSLLLRTATRLVEGSCVHWLLRSSLRFVLSVRAVF